MECCRQKVWLSGVNFFVAFGDNTSHNFISISGNNNFDLTRRIAEEDFFDSAYADCVYIPD